MSRTVAGFFFKIERFTKKKLKIRRGRERKTSTKPITENASIGRTHSIFKRRILGPPTPLTLRWGLQKRSSFIISAPLGSPAKIKKSDLLARGFFSTASGERLIHSTRAALPSRRLPPQRCSSGCRDLDSRQRERGSSQLPASDGRHGTWFQREREKSESNSSCPQGDRGCRYQVEEFERGEKRGGFPSLVLTPLALPPDGSSREFDRAW